MNITVAQKHIYGKSIRTNNENTDVIGSLWEEILRSPVKGDIYAIYHNYESDFTGEYDLHIGTEEKWLDVGSVAILADNYHVVEVDHHDPQGIFKAWADIWKSDINRTYKTDFECHKEDGTIRIFLSVE